MASRYDDSDNDDYDDVPRSRRRSRGYQCPYCDCPDPPLTRSQISQGGWIMFVVMILFCWPLFWIGLLMTETYLECPDCRRRIVD